AAGRPAYHNYFNPWIRLYGPDGVLVSQGAVAGDLAEEIAFQASLSGTFTVVVADGNYGDITGTGAYELHYLNLAAGFILPAGDEGGPLTNGGDYSGTILTGDLDPWTFTANAGQTVLLRIGELTTTNYFDPWLRLYGPDGVLVAQGAVAGAIDSQISLRTTNGGTFTVVVADGNYSGFGGTGIYDLHYLKVPGDFVVPPGDQGGRITSTSPSSGTIDIGDLDPWTFTACEGDIIHFNLTTTNFTGNLGLYGPTGALVKNAGGTINVNLAYMPTNCGPFTLVVSSSAVGGTGTYQLSGNVLDTMRLCFPSISGTNLTLCGVGGPTNAQFVLYSTTNVAAPWALWTPIYTNLFDQLGVFSYSSLYYPAVPQQYFRFQLP
ncbi:MAG: hypothetical protein ACREIC_21290, partial [Limisphaerales bacterium]